MEYAELAATLGWGGPFGANPNVDAEEVSETNAGTKPLTFTTDDQWVVKIGSEREEFAYTNANDFNLANVLVDFAVATPVGIGATFSSVTINGHVKQLKKSLPRPTGSERIIATRRMGQGNVNQTFTMDIKIGTYTKSEEQFELEGHYYPMRVLKRFEHELKDRDPGFRWGAIGHGSRGRGYDVDLKGKKAFDANKANGNFGACVTKLAQDVHNIRTSVGNNPSAIFVGSSLFCFVDLNNPANSEAKILDPDHPLILDENATLAQLPPTMMSKTKFDAQQQEKWFGKKDWGAYSQKHRDSFVDGLAAIELALTNQNI